MTGRITINNTNGSSFGCSSKFSLREASGRLTSCLDKSRLHLESAIRTQSYVSSSKFKQLSKVFFEPVHLLNEFPEDHPTKSMHQNDDYLCDKSGNSLTPPMNINIHHITKICDDQELSSSSTSLISAESGEVGSIMGEIDHMNKRIQTEGSVDLKSSSIERGGPSTMRANLKICPPLHITTHQESCITGDPTSVLFKRGPGRPRKYQPKDPTVPRRPRGRPRKYNGLSTSLPTSDMMIPSSSGGGRLTTNNQIIIKSEDTTTTTTTTLLHTGSSRLLNLINEDTKIDTIQPPPQPTTMQRQIGGTKHYFTNRILLPSQQAVDMFHDGIIDDSTPVFSDVNSLPMVSISPFKRGPGRPRKYPPKDPNAPKRKPGRPRKYPPKDPSVPKRPRGRPRKYAVE